MELGVFPDSCHFKSCEDDFTKVFIGVYGLILTPLANVGGRKRFVGRPLGY